MTSAALYTAHLRALESAYAGALEACGFDAVILHSGALARRTAFDDQDWPLRVTPHFQHWLALAEPDCFLLVRAGQRPVLFRPKHTSFWEHLAAPPARFFLEHVDVREVESWERVREHIPAGGRVAFVGERADRAEALGFGEGARNPQALMARLDALRTRKSAYEIACIAAANVIAARGHEALRAAFAAGETNELRLHLLFLRATDQDDPETPYKNIVATGRNAATLHHVTYGKDASGAPSLLVDAGATCFGYCSDITRTWVRQGGGEASSRFLGLVQAVEVMQRVLCDAVAAGTRYEALHDRSHRLVSGILREVGIVKANALSAEEVDARGISRAFYPHGLGHSLGLQTHDVGCAVMEPRPDNPFLRNTSIIEPGQVFTIEPGVYFIDSLLAPLREGKLAAAIDWKLVDALAPLGGVRIEDDVHVRADGPLENFTRAVLPIGGGAV